jgi:hypothetical protein
VRLANLMVTKVCQRVAQDTARGQFGIMVLAADMPETFIETRVTNAGPRPRTPQDAPDSQPA